MEKHEKLENGKKLRSKAVSTSLGPYERTCPVYDMYNIHNKYNNNKI